MEFFEPYSTRKKFADIKSDGFATIPNCWKIVPHRSQQVVSSLLVRVDGISRAML